MEFFSSKYEVCLSSFLAEIPLCPDNQGLLSLCSDSICYQLAIPTSVLPCALPSQTTHYLGLEGYLLVLQPSESHLLIKCQNYCLLTQVAQRQKAFLLSIL